MKNIKFFIEYHNIICYNQILLYEFKTDISKLAIQNLTTETS